MWREAAHFLPVKVHANISTYYIYVKEEAAISSGLFAVWRNVYAGTTSTTFFWTTRPSKLVLRRLRKETLPTTIE